MKNPKSIRALFAFPGFNASSKLVGKFGDRSCPCDPTQAAKKTAICGHCGHLPRALRQEGAAYETCRLWRIYLDSNAGSDVRGAAACM